MNIWYHQLGFDTNPFNIKPAAFSNELVGHHLSIVLERISDGQVQYIEAPLGSGKTTLLKQIISKFGGKGKVMYANCIDKECIHLITLLQNATVKGRLFGTLPKDMILLVDEAQFLCNEDAVDIVYYLSEANIKAVVFFGIEYKSSSMTDHLREALAGNVVQLPYLSPDQAVELIQNRIGSLRLLPEYVVRELYARAQGNPRRLLQLCEDICRRAVDLNITELTTPDISKLLFLETPKKKAVKVVKTVVAKPEKPVKKAAKAKPAKKAAKKSTKNGNKSKKGPKVIKIIDIKSKDVDVSSSYSSFDVKNIRSYEDEWGSKKDPLDER